MSGIAQSINDFQRAGRFIFNSTTLINGVTQIAPVAANLTIRPATLIGFAGAGGVLTLYSDQAAPANATDLTKRKVFETASTTSVFHLLNFRCNRGDGLWIATNSAGAAIYLTWDYL